MARKNIPSYHRLPGGRLTRHSLWQADDHLLNVERREFTERYARFYFRDIQAIVVQRTSNHVIWATIFVSFTVLWALLAITRESTGAMVFWWIMAAAFGTVAAWNWLSGPTCVCYLFTAIDRYRVRSLSRMGIANQVIGMLKPAIQRAQEDIDIPPLENPIADSGQPASLGMYLRQPHTTHVRPATSPVAHYHGAMHIAVFVLLLMNGFSLAGVLLMYGYLSIGGYTATLAALGVCMVVALVKQTGTDVPNSVKGLIGGMLGYMSISFITGFAFLIMTAYKYLQEFGEELVNNELTMAKASLRFPLFMGIYLVMIGSALLIGGLGLIFIRRFRQEYTPPTP